MPRPVMICPDCSSAVDSELWRAMLRMAKGDRAQVPCACGATGKWALGIIDPPLTSPPNRLPFQQQTLYRQP